MGIQKSIKSAPDAHFPQASRAAREGSDAEAFEAALADMASAFSNDYADGRVGLQHNIFEHRARVLRQMGDQLASMRVPNLLGAM